MLLKTERASPGDEPASAGREPVDSRVARVLIVLAGIVLTQAVLYWPCLIGRKILLPVDILTLPSVYLPQTPQLTTTTVHNLSLSDLIYHAEPARRFAISEFKAGRLPLWSPYYFAGAPFIWPKFSPFLAFECCTASPVILAWGQMLVALVAGLGAYTFCRRVLAVGFWPSAVAGWCYPLTGFFVLWQGFTTCLPVVWLPWILLAVDKTVRGAHALAPIGLGVVTCLVVISGQLDIAAQVLLGSGLFGLWRLYELCRGHWLVRRTGAIVLKLAAAWALGLMLAMPYVLPVLNYTHTGMRMTRRSAGDEERPPEGLAALPQTVLPYMYGTRESASYRLVPRNEMESSAATYAGVLATLLVAPLAWCSRRHRSLNIFWALLCFLSLSWCLDVPGYVDILRLPGLNMVSHNRMVFLASFALVAMMAEGLEVILEGAVCWRRWLWVPALLLAGLCAWCAYRAVVPAEPVATQLAQSVPHGYSTRWIKNVDDVHRVQGWFLRYYIGAAFLCGVGFLGWLLLRYQPKRLARLWPALALFLVGDLLWFAWGRSAQCEPALYFPPVPVLEQVAHATPGRVIGAGCLPAGLASIAGLHDIRGYDAVDPARLVELLTPASEPQPRTYPYAQTQWLTPKARLGPDGGLHLLPVMDMLSVRYVITRGDPPPEIRLAFRAPDYWVVVNSNALPRAYIPLRVETEPNDQARVEKLTAGNFDPRAVAYVESPVNLPGPCRGTAEIIEDLPTRIKVSVRMETPGLLVLADLWDSGWHASLNGNPLPILRTNHAIRGVVLPAGAGIVEFRYAPAGFSLGLKLAGAAALALLAWAGIGLRKSTSIAS